MTRRIRACGAIRIPFVLQPFLRVSERECLFFHAVHGRSPSLQNATVQSRRGQRHVGCPLTVTHIAHNSESDCAPDVIRDPHTKSDDTYIDGTLQTLHERMCSAHFWPHIINLIFQQCDFTGQLLFNLNPRHATGQSHWSAASSQCVQTAAAHTLSH